MVRIIFLLQLFLLLEIEANAQCDNSLQRDGFYDRVAPGYKTIYNEPTYGFGQCKSLSVIGNKSYLVFDHNVSNIRFPNNFHNMNYEWRKSFDSLSKGDSVFLFDLRNRNENYFACISAWRINNLLHLSDFSLGISQDELRIINYENDSLYKFKINLTIHGYDENIAYAYLGEKKFCWHKMKFSYGDLVKISKEGIELVGHDTFKNVSKTFPTFLNNNYKVFYDYTPNNDVSSFTVKVYYHDSLIDMFNEPMLYHNIRVENDSLEIIHETSYRKYVNGKILGRWTVKNWRDANPILCRESVNQMFCLGKYLLVQVNADTSYTNGIAIVNGKRFTMNNYPIRPESNQYSLIMLFDIEKSIFIGYPEVQYLNY